MEVSSKTRHARDADVYGAFSEVSEKIDDGLTVIGSRSDRRPLISLVHGAISSASILGDNARNRDRVPGAAGARRQLPSFGRGQSFPRCGVLRCLANSWPIWGGACTLPGAGEGCSTPTLRLARYLLPTLRDLSHASPTVHASLRSSGLSPTDKKKYRRIK